MGKFKGYPLPLGVTEYGDYVNFSVEAKGAKNCRLFLYKKGAGQVKTIYEMQQSDVTGDVRYIGLPARLVKGREYVYEMDGVFKIDAYAKELCIYENGEKRSKVLLDTYDWEDDAPLQIPEHHVVAYSMHIRGLTRHKSSGVRHKGCFKGVIERLPYLQKLGINQIQCMPVYAFEDGKNYTNYWGYGEGYFFAPHPRYASGRSAVRELKDMVKACHRAGIEVVLNLPFSAEFLPQMVIDCLRHYVMEYHIDGFLLQSARVNMAGVKGDPILKNVKILEQKDDYMMAMRRFLIGTDDSIEETMEWLKSHTGAVGSYNYVAGHNGFTLADAFSYNEKHNEANGENNQDGPDCNYSFNCGVEGPTRKKEVQMLRRQMIKNAFFMLFTSQGTPCILAGDEFANSQQGNNNVYCQDNELAWLDWKQAKKEDELLAYVKCLIALRKRYPVLGSDKALLGKDYVGCGVPDVSFHSELAWQAPSGQGCRSVGVYYHDERLTISECFVAYNAANEERQIALPALAKGKKWHRVVSSTEKEDMGKERIPDNQRAVMLKPREMALYIGK